MKKLFPFWLVVGLVLAAAIVTYGAIRCNT
jgi:hypothetical protein